MVAWLPQNDVLGHAQTRAFLSHCGANSLYEAAYHGVPIVALPFFGDQPGAPCMMHLLDWRKKTKLNSCSLAIPLIHADVTACAPSSTGNADIAVARVRVSALHLGSSVKKL